MGRPQPGESIFEGEMTNRNKGNDFRVMCAINVAIENPYYR